jgi:hypothetical protein
MERFSPTLLEQIDERLRTTLGMTSVMGYAHLFVNPP